MENDPIKKPVKLLVGHQNPDLDVVGAMWLFRRFDAEIFEGAQLYFVPAGEEVSDEVLTAKDISRDTVVHVDTGKGIFDHHQDGHTAHDSATLLVYEYLTRKHPELADDTALRRIVTFINETDHFSSYWWSEPTDDRYIFGLEELLSGLRSGKEFTDHEIIEFGRVCLDGAYVSMKIRVSAEADIKALGQEFQTRWGKALAIENQNDEVIKLAQKMGYEVVVRKDREYGNVRIKAAPKKEINLRGVYEKILEVDQVGNWFFHPSGQMLINGSKKNTGHKPSPLTLDEIVTIVKEDHGQ